LWFCPSHLAKVNESMNAVFFDQEPSASSHTAVAVWQKAVITGLHPGAWRRLERDCETANRRD
jgi:hypothetical protein